MQRSREEQPQEERGWGTRSRPLSAPEDTGHGVGIPSSGTAAGWGSHRNEPGPGRVGQCDRRTTGEERRWSW